MKGKAMPLAVVALGGNAISPPGKSLAFAPERAAVDAAAAELALLAASGLRLLVVHGNGPQVGRLLLAPGCGDPDSLDIHVAQTQGELGYLLAEALEKRLPGTHVAAIVTRVLVDANDPAFTHPTKPVGAILATPPIGAASTRTPDGRGWRRVVASPRPLSVIERDTIAALLPGHHVIAGGGGGIAIAAAGSDRRAVAAVIDKDWVAAALAVSLHADHLVFVTDVPHAFDGFGGPGQRPIATMTVADARARLAHHVFAPGSMAPKVESAVEFVAATGRPALIAALGAIEAARHGRAGTVIVPD